ncbi:helix-turn-helix domain-containing protein [Streptomyces sp. MZ04]|uniref:helix-turn-helix domain-containing protein n=1 Tax=Streptomyces sp. MZ04 TaxID=2559236 RepID=UPI00107EC82A|nr:helix-turn-helix domain-containing protein [Streptomyces sp. MZ04]TGA90319.1 helix-turn-helix domain-containing protein [Streptomyces sp. MZ04]
MTQSPATPLPPPKERRRLREATSLSQAELATKVGVTKETVRSWESGRTAPRGRRREIYAKLLATFTEEQKSAVHGVGRHSAGRNGWAQRTLPSTAKTNDRPTPSPVAVATPEAPPAKTLTPAEAFDELCATCAPSLVRQTYLLTGRRALAQESVERAFQLAWQRWPEVAVDRDPASWVRAAAYEYAMSPWHRLRPAHRHPDAPPAERADRAFLDVLMSLPPAQRRTLLLYDGVGLDLPETAAETEASTPAAANRLLRAHETITEKIPELAATPDALHRRLSELCTAEKLRPPKADRVRTGSEDRARFWTRAAIALTALITGATALTLHTAPTRYEPPQSPGKAISGVPPRMGPGPLSYADQTLHSKLRAEFSSGPERLTPRAE